jgi:hypothetical protein
MRAFLLVLLLAACASPPKPAAPEDAEMRRSARVGRVAFNLERPDEAVTQYRAALSRAQARDDLPAIADLGYDLAVAQLRANDPKAALATATSIRAELARRRAPDLPELDLAEATALYRTGAPAQSDALAASVQRAGDPEAAARASFLRGLIADAAGDTAGLQSALASLGAPADAETQADAAELSARLKLRQGDPAGARADAQRAAALRRDLPDYRGLARALALEAQAARQAGDQSAAADLYLRAGRSAAAQGDTDQARMWLRQAGAASDPAIRQAAATALAALTSGN